MTIPHHTLATLPVEEARLPPSPSLEITRCTTSRLRTVTRMEILHDQHRTGMSTSMHLLLVIPFMGKILPDLGTACCICYVERICTLANHMTDS